MVFEIFVVDRHHSRAGQFLHYLWEEIDRYFAVPSADDRNSKEGVTKVDSLGLIDSKFGERTNELN